MNLIAVRPGLAGVLGADYAWFLERGVSVFETDAGSSGELAAALGGEAFEGVLLMDDLPSVVYPEALDGHSVMYDVAHDPLLCPGRMVGRLDYSHLDGVTALDAYRAYFARLKTFMDGGPQQPYQVRLLDGFTVTVPQIAANLKRALAGVPDSRIDTYSAFRNAPLDPNGPGPSLLAKPAMFHLDFSGGMDQTWLWQVGHESDVVSHPLDMTFGAVFGSRMASPQMANAIIRAYLLWALFLVYDYYGEFPWYRVLAGESVGAIALSLGYRWTTVYGVPWEGLGADMVNAIQTFPELVARQDALEARQTAIENAIAAGGKAAVVVPGLPKVTLAVYRQVANPSVGIDVTAKVQAAINGGRELYVYSDSRPCLSDPGWSAAGGRDPYPDRLKELFVAWTAADGTPRTHVFKQLDAIVLA